MANDRVGVITALKDTALKLQNPTSPDDASLYLKLFKKCLDEKHFDGSELWLEDVESVTKMVSAEVETVQNGIPYLLVHFSYNDCSTLVMYFVSLQRVRFCHK